MVRIVLLGDAFPQSAVAGAVAALGAALDSAFGPDPSNVVVIRSMPAVAAVRMRDATESVPIRSKSPKQRRLARGWR